MNRRSLLPALLVTAISLVVAMILFGKSTWGGHFVLDRSPGYDVYHLSTLYERFGFYLRQGAFPLYFPEFGGGFPVAAAWMYGLYHPATAIFALLPPDLGWTWSAILHLAFAAAGMFLFLRALGHPAAAAATGAFCFVFGEATVGRVLVGHLNILWPIAWIPWILLGVRRCAAGARGGVAVLAVAAGLGLISGHAQVWFYAGPLVAAYALGRLLAGPNRRAALGRLAAAGLFAAALSSVQWLSALEFLRVAEPPPPDEVLGQSFSAPAHFLVAKLFPGILGTVPDTYWAPEPFWQEYLGPGGLPLLLLVLLGLFARGRGRWLWLGAIVLGAAVALGDRNPLSAALNGVPPLSLARAPARALALVLLGASVLASRGVAHWFESGGTRRLAAAGLATLVAGAAALAWLGSWMAGLGLGGRAAEIRSDVWIPAVAGGVGAALGVALVLALARRAIRTRPVAAWLAPAAALGALLLVAVPRIDTAPSGFYFHPWAESLPPEVRGHRVHVGSQWRFPNPEREGVRGMRMVAPGDVPWTWAMLTDGHPPLIFWLDIRLDIVPVLPRELGGDGLPPGILAYDPTPSCGRARLFPSAVGPVPDEEARRILLTGRRVLLLDGPVPPPSGAPRPATEGRELAVEADGPNHLGVAVEASGPSWLYLSEKPYPGWVAEVDGREAPIVRANVCGMAVPVPDGRSEVRLTFAPLSSRLGLLLALLAALALVAGEVIRRRRS